MAHPCGQSRRPIRCRRARTRTGRRGIRSILRRHKAPRGIGGERTLARAALGEKSPLDDVERALGARTVGRFGERELAPAALVPAGVVETRRYPDQLLSGAKLDPRADHYFTFAFSCPTPLVDALRPAIGTLDEGDGPDRTGFVKETPIGQGCRRRRRALEASSCRCHRSPLSR